MLWWIPRRVNYKLGDRELNEFLEVVGSVAQWFKVVHFRRGLDYFTSKDPA